MDACRLKWTWVVVALTVAVGLSGCRNRAPYCQPGCYSPAPFGVAAGSPTVAAPGTYSLQIPGQGAPVYYNNGVATAQQIPAASTGTLPPVNPRNTQSGWQPAGTATGGTTGTLPVSTTPSALPNPGTTSSVTSNSGAGLVSVIDRSAPANRVASNVNPGISRTNDTNFRTTAVDERQDSSRLPVTDASSVRAPTTFNPVTTVGQFNAPYYNYGQNRIADNRVAVLPPQAVPVNNGTVVGNFAQPMFSLPAPQIYRGQLVQNPQLLGQSTVYADPANDPNFQNGWRDRDLTAARDSINR